MLLLPFQGAKRWLSHRGPRVALIAEIEELAGQLRVAPPPPAPPHVESFGVGIRVLLGAAAVGALLLVLGMAMG